MAIRTQPDPDPKTQEGNRPHPPRNAAVELTAPGGEAACALQLLEPPSVRTPGASEQAGQRRNLGLDQLDMHGTRSVRSGSIIVGLLD